MLLSIRYLLCVGIALLFIDFNYNEGRNFLKKKGRIYEKEISFYWIRHSVSFSFIT